MEEMDGKSVCYNFTTNLTSYCPFASSVMDYHCFQEILLVGEGDFSFAASLAKSFCIADNIVATSLDPRETVIRKYSHGLENLRLLEQRCATVIHDVDAITMNDHRELENMRFDRIIFNFPHAGLGGREDSISNIRAHQRLVAGFFSAARDLLHYGGEIHVTHKTTHPYDRWGIEDLAEDAGLVLVEKCPFRMEEYPGYVNKKAYGSNWDSSFPVGRSSTFVFADCCC